jgi:hypothetical protein
LGFVCSVFTHDEINDLTRLEAFYGISSVHEPAAWGIDAGNFDEVERGDPGFSQGLFKACQFFFVLAFPLRQEYPFGDNAIHSLPI